MRVFALILLFSSLAVGARAGEIRGHVSLKNGLLDGARRSATRSATELTDAGYGNSEVDSDREGSAPFDPGHELSNVVIFLEGPGLSRGKAKDAYITQKNKAFDPHVLPVVTGTTVYFANEDHILHHVYALKPEFEFKKFPYIVGGNKCPHQTVKLGREVPTVIELFCQIHARMNAYIVVLPNVYFTKADNQGGFLLTDIPAGTYTVRAWHPRAQPRSVRVANVTVPEKGLVNLDLAWK